MIKNFFIILSIVLIVGGICWIFYTKKSHQNTLVFTLYKESGNVFAKTGSEEYAAISSESVSLPSGSTVKTEDGVAHAILSDNSTISIDSGTELTISDNGKTETKIMQYVGKTWHRVEKLLGRTYEVETPTTVAVVRGTKFGVDVSDDVLKSSEVYVTQNSVSISRIAIDQGKKVRRFTKTLETNHIASISKNQSESDISVSPLDQQFKERPWIKRVEKLEKIFENKKPKEAVKEVIRELKTDPELQRIEENRKQDFIQRVKSNPEVFNNIQKNLETRMPTRQDFRESGKNDDALSAIKRRYDPRTGSDVCKTIQDGTLEKDVNTLNSLKGTLGLPLPEIISYLNELKNLCSKGALNQEDIKLLMDKTRSIAPDVNINPENVKIVPDSIPTITNNPIDQIPLTPTNQIPSIQPLKIIQQ
ncbi:FecR domain-containing protein [Candidatus Gottesmanbacteria bacterium]|nr:FecR domain-containing protein [Candidatus Gottesmanbacteria bacterium]